MVMNRPKNKLRFTVQKNGKHWDVMLWNSHFNKWKQHWVGLSHERAIEELAWLEKAGHKVEWPKDSKRG